MVRILDRVVANMAAMLPGAELDINNVTLRLALDITGEVSRRTDAAAVKAWACVRPARQLRAYHWLWCAVLRVAVLS